ncbi:MAG: hypothetical protein KF830_13045 [Planctomycetes bacterium]|nr:hypothetical protein [Planctomycetota bacterium]
MLRRLAACALLAGALPAQLWPVPVPAENPPTPAKVMLGKILFWDEQLSSDDSTACGTCHQPAFGGSDPRAAEAWHPGPDGVFGTDDDRRGSLGVSRQAANGRFRADATFGFGRQATPRTAPSHLGAAYHIDLFWDARASTQFTDPETGVVLIAFEGALESQAVGPILNPVEMGREGRTWLHVRQKLQQVAPLALAESLTPDVQAALWQNPTYPALFAAAFGSPEISAARIAFALASYQRTQIPDDTPWDRFIAGDDGAMTSGEKTGWIVFQGTGRCIACHWAPTFSDDMWHVLGLRPAAEDLGVGAFTGVPDDLGAFKTPSLRNAGLRPRLFHNGQSPPLGDLAQWTDPNSTLNVYLRGHGTVTDNLDPFLLPLQQLGVTAAEVHATQEFVRTALTDERAALALPPFDHPVLRSTAAPAPRTFGPGLAGARGEPFLIDTVPSYPGNQDWKLGLVASRGTTIGLLALGASPFEPHVPWFGLPWNVQPAGGRLFFLPGGSNRPGNTTWFVPIPAAMPPQSVYLQLFTLDQAAPGGIAASRGTELPIW